MWAEELAKKIIKEKGKDLFVSTMVTPSGPIHLGNLKEVMIGYLIAKALKQEGARVSFNFFADNFDYLRRLYPFLSPKYEKYVGVPLSEIPDLEGCHKTYDEHFLAPFLEALKILNVQPTIRYVDSLYKKGVYAPLIKKALQNRDKIAQIIKEISGRQVAADWSPFMPICQSCGKMSTTKVVDVVIEKNCVVYQCLCGHKGNVDFSKGGGKLGWRVHWPAGWKIFGVDVEGFGKDLATKGGAYDTAKVIIKEVFRGKPPFPIPYEWVYLKGEGKMAGSTGVGFTPQEVLEVMPPHLLIYFYERIKPNKHVVFDLGEGLAPLWNEAGGLSGIPFEHLVVTAQSAFSFEEMLDGLSRTGYKTQATRHKEKIKQEIGYIQNWLKKYAPARYKFAVQKKLPKIRLSAIQKEFLSNILTAFTNIEWTGEKLHQEIHRIKNHLKISPREAFSSIYQIFLNKDSGPKVGWFLASLSKDFVIKRLKEATK